MTPGASERPLRIAMVAACPFPYPRGTPVRAYRMAEALAQRGHEVHAVTYHLGEVLEEPPFTIHRIPAVPTYRKLDPGPSYQKLAVVDPLLSRKLARVVREQRIDVIHAHHYEGLLVSLPVRWRRGTPVVYDAHTVLDSELHHYNLGLMRRLKKRISRYFDANLPRRADHVVAVTRDIADKLTQRYGVPTERVTAVVNGVECDHFDIPRPTRDPAGPRVLVFAGNLAAYQGVEPMLRALAKLRAAGCADVRLLIASCSSLEPYAALVRELSIGDAIDHQPSDFRSLPTQLARAEIALNPRSECDGIPQKLLNYMAAGLPVISFAGSAKDITDGELGRIVPNGDVDGFAAAIAELLDDPAKAQRIGDNARAYVRAERSWARVAECNEMIYRRLLSRDVPTGSKVQTADSTAR
ncbi:MAG: glycosyltransferase family 4 protein [Phycisphaeraceae bacterium]